MTQYIYSNLIFTKQNTKYNALLFLCSDMFQLIQKHESLNLKEFQRITLFFLQTSDWNDCCLHLRHSEKSLD